MIFSEMRKKPLQQLLIHLPNLFELGKSLPNLLSPARVYWTI